MAGPSPSTDASASALPKESTFPIPPPTAIKALTPEPVASAAPPPVPSVRVIAPPRGTLAAGKYEAKPSTIWIVVALGALVLLGWALFRVRRAALERKKKQELLTSLKKPGARPS